MNRTEEQEFANNFDMEIFRLMRKAGCRSEKGVWGRVVILLRELRPIVRSRMHNEDRRTTE